MLCENCQKRPAAVHFTQVVNNDKVEMYLCEQCANEKGQFNFGSPLSINDFFSGLIGYGNAAQYRTAAVPERLVCEKCGMSHEEFQKIGKLGCSNCYEIYLQRISPLLKRLHGNVEHHGKIPAKLLKSIKEDQEVERLKEQLNKAIQAEEYEKAAKIRDQIKKLEAGKVK